MPRERFRLGRCEQQVIVRAHEAVEMAAPAVAGACPLHELEAGRASVVVGKDESPRRAAGRDVEQAAGDLESRRTGHGGESTSRRAAAETNAESWYELDSLRTWLGSDPCDVPFCHDLRAGVRAQQVYASWRSPATTGSGSGIVILPSRPAASRSACALSIRSHVKSRSSRPKCPYAAVFAKIGRRRSRSRMIAPGRRSKCSRTSAAIFSS